MLKRIAIGVAIFFICLMFVSMVIKPCTIAAQEDDSKTADKLDKVLNNQKEILDGIEDIKRELDIIKVRVTR